MAKHTGNTPKGYLNVQNWLQTGGLHRAALRLLNPPTAQVPGAASAWMAALLAFLGPVVAAILINQNVVDQLTDIFSPLTASESSVTKAIPLFGTGPYPIGWLVVSLLAAGMWLMVACATIRVAWRIAPPKRRSAWMGVSTSIWLIASVSNPALWQVFLVILGLVLLAGIRCSTTLPVSITPSVINLVKRIGWIAPFRRPRHQLTYVRLFVAVYLACPGILLVAALLLQLAAPMTNMGRGIDPQPIALAVAYSLMLWVVNSMALWALGTALQVRTWAKTALLMPFCLLFVLLFAPIEFLPDTADANGRKLPPTTPPLLTSLRSPDADTLPFIGIACSGGGSRAAIFTAAIFSRLWWFAPENPTDWQAMVTTLQRQGLTQPELDAIFERDQAGQLLHYYPGRLLLARADVISSVSGGSLAAGYFVQAIAQRANRLIANGKTPREARILALSDFFGKSAEGFKLQRITSNDESYSGLDERELEQLAKHWESDGYLTSMGLDHLAAVIAGFANPLMGRGRGIETYWESKFGWSAGQTPGYYFADLQSLEASGAIPHLILNSTNIETGGRVAITNLDAGLFAPMFSVGPSKKDDESFADIHTAFNFKTYTPASQPRFDPIPGSVSVFRNLVPGDNITLSRAIRASSNFPFGFPLMSFRAPDPANPKRRVELTDGGVLDNTGVDCLMALVRGRFHPQRLPVQIAKAQPGSPERRVFIFQIDSGELGADRDVSSLDSFDHHYSATQNAIWRATQYGNAIAIASSVEELQIESGYGRFSTVKDRNKTEKKAFSVRGLKSSTGEGSRYVSGRSGPEFGFYRTRLGEYAADHIPTSWHLRRVDRGRIYQTFRGLYVQTAIENACDSLMCLSTDESPAFKVQTLGNQLIEAAGFHFPKISPISNELAK